jgi:hypothetical protein
MTFYADPSKVVGDRASEHASEGCPRSRARSPGHDTREKACFCDVPPIALACMLTDLDSHQDDA